MLISKFDLYKSGWLELVFENRNKAYGAYELRQHYAKTMVSAMGFAFLGVGLLCGASILFSAAPTESRTIVEITPTVPVLPPVAPPVKKIPTPPSHAIKQVTPVNPPTMTKFVPPVVVVDEQAQKPVINDQIKTAIGSETSKGPTTTTNVIPTGPTPGNGAPAPDANIVYDMGAGLDVMPTPAGGDAAWAKFLNKNLRFPFQAQEDGVSGRSILSFIIEKDGTLSNITIVRPAGYGFDEEALRVLKLAKAWKPGMQNGQPVRVKFVIPINFTVAEQQ